MCVDDSPHKEKLLLYVCVYVCVGILFVIDKLNVEDKNFIEAKCVYF